MKIIDPGVMLHLVADATQRAQAVFAVTTDWLDTLAEIAEAAEMGRPALLAEAELTADDKYLSGFADGLAGRQIQINHATGGAPVQQQRRHLALVPTPIAQSKE